MVQFMALVTTMVQVQVTEELPMLLKSMMGIYLEAFMVVQTPKEQFMVIV